MKDTLIQIIGQYISSEAQGIAALDIPWIFAAILFITLIIMTAWFACRILVGVLHE